jgi:ADP-ribose pyrophosphatase YjhB (NUDIX family)
MFNVRDMHHIQKDILQSLTGNFPRRFSDLQPPHIPNNTFSYHLKKLLEAGYIQLTESGYVATRKALKTLQFSDDSHSKRAVAPTMISIVYVTRSSGEILLLKRKKRPFVEWFGVPSGLIHHGENLQDAARRELFEKTSVTTKDDLEFCGVLDFQYHQPVSGDLFIHAVGFVYKYEISESEIVKLDMASRYGTLQWSNLNHDMILPEVYTIDSLAQAQRPAITSIDFVEPIL